MSNQSASIHEPSATDASHSAIGRSTAIDYNLGSIHKNAILIVNETVAIQSAIVNEAPNPAPLNG